MPGKKKQAPKAKKRKDLKVAGNLGGKSCPPGAYWDGTQCVSVVDDKPV